MTRPQLLKAIVITVVLAVGMGLLATVLCFWFFIGYGFDLSNAIHGRDLPQSNAAFWVVMHLLSFASAATITSVLLWRRASIWFQSPGDA